MSEYDKIMLERDIAELKLALSDSNIVLNDWMTTFASEFCFEETVKAAHERISNGGGTLMYIARRVEKNNKLIKPE